MAVKTGFVAYPAEPEQLSNTLREGIEKANQSGRCAYRSWEENDIAGRHLISPIVEQMEESNVLIADITKINFNVTYEIGYAIGIGKRVVLLKNKEIKDSSSEAKKIGIFDTLGYEEYENAEELSSKISNIDDLTPNPKPAHLNISTPLYIVETPFRGQVINHIISRVKRARLFYRSFIPSEESRMSAIDAIGHVASSYGVLVPLLNEEMEESFTHNIRAAFVAGLAHGMEVPTLILQDREGPLSPLDVRDFVKDYGHPDDIDQHIHDFSLSVYEKMQEATNIELPVDNLLSRVILGDPMAENEFQSLGAYYLQTDEFGRAYRGEVNLVVGRKGTGKTALFSQLRNKKREDKDNIVVDLKPEGYQLIKLKEKVLSYLSAGSKAHLITAFWEYLLYLEVCHKILEKDKEKHMRDHRLTEGYQRLYDLYQHSLYEVEGDFSERLNILSDHIVDEYTSNYSEDSEEQLTSDNVTSLVHSYDIPSLRKNLSDYLKNKEEIFLLFDNLDKGWSSHGLAEGDIVILRCLIDAARKIQRQMLKEGHEFHAVVFVRNDVFQLLMDESSDFGKESRASLDWTDKDSLRELLRKRIIYNDLPNDATFQTVWSKLCVSHYGGVETSEFMIDRSLMRPRNLLKLVSACRGFAVNMQHEKIEEDDIKKGLRAYSNDLAVDADQELTDVEPKAKYLIYQFYGENPDFTPDELKLILEINGIPEDKFGTIIQFLLYYGFLGIKYADSEPQYIYDVGYNMQIIKTRIKKNEKAIKYELNPAFWSALEIGE